MKIRTEMNTRWKCNQTIGKGMKKKVEGRESEWNRIGVRMEMNWIRGNGKNRKGHGNKRSQI